MMWWVAIGKRASSYRRCDKASRDKGAIAREEAESAIDGSS